MPHTGQGQELKPRLPRKFPRRRLLAAAGAAVAGATIYGIDKTFGIPIPGIAKDGDSGGTGSKNLLPGETQTAIETATATSTPEPTNTPESKYSPDSFRERIKPLNKQIGTSVDVGEDVNLLAYQRVAGENFNMIFTDGPLIQTVMDKYEKLSADNVKTLRKLADNYDQVFFAHPGLWVSGDMPDYVKNGLVSPQDYMQKRADLFAGLVRPVDQGYQPTYINFLTEALWVVEDKGQVFTGWDKNPLYLAFKDRLMTEAYVTFYKTLIAKGFKLGKDFRLGYSDYDLHTPGPKADFVYSVMSKSRKEIATVLGIPEEEVQIDISSQCHFDISPTSGLLFHPIPKESDMMAGADRFSKLGAVHFTEFDVRGTDDQSIKTNVMIMVNRVLKNSPGVISLSYWNNLRKKPRSDNDKFFSQNGLIDQNYQTTDVYKQVADALK